ncbi:MAG: RNA polymerase sigma factor, partial [Coprobacillaceae bacterium]
MDKKEKLTQIVRIVQDDMSQFELLYSHISTKVYYWCYTVVTNESIAKDLVQESMIKIYEKLHTLDNPDAFYSWMY